MTKLIVALDWTPNTNHSGFFVAQAQGLYRLHGLDVEFVSPLDDSYSKTPRQRVEAGEAHFGVAPSETVISCHTSDTARVKGQRIIAVAALLQVSCVLGMAEGSFYGYPSVLSHAYPGQQGLASMPL